MKNFLISIVFIGGLALACQAVSAADSFADKYLTSGDFLIKNVTVIDGLGNKQKGQQDIFISDGKFTLITDSGKKTPSSSTQVIDGKGLTAIPGLIDAHMHIKTQWHGGGLYSKTSTHKIVPEKNCKKLSLRSCILV